MTRFVDPRPGLKLEYEAALARLRAETGQPRTLRERLRFRRRVFALRRRYLGVAGVPASWFRRRDS